MLYYILVIILSLIGFFVNIDLLGFTGNILLKIMLFSGLGFIVYRQYSASIAQDEKQQSLPDQEESKSVTQPTEQIFLESSEKGDINKLLSDKTISLNSLLLSQFEILFNYFLPANGYIFIQNKKNDLRLFYKQIKQNISWTESDETPSIIKLLRNHSNEILVENNLGNGSNILPYYTDSNYTPGSILSLSTKITEDQKIFWVFDAPATGYFNEEDFKVLTQVSFTSQFLTINAFKQKHVFEDLSRERNKLELANKLNGCSTKDKLTSVFIEFLAELFEAHKLTVAMVDENNTQMATITKTIGQIDSIKAGTRFSLNEGLCGKVLTNKQIYLLDDIEKDGYFIPRFSKNEKTNYGLHSFLAIPFINQSEAIGLLILEHKTPGFYQDNHKIELNEYCEYYSVAISRFVENQYFEGAEE
ncbi:MAG: GAF domain-containing protein [Calditrichaeota bacterium]|nr:MAG: GAF domain-containing protein [Calditrichota bacterium]MBL1205498.1 GAF domain-containing protein [Calditrichota bacterium]NOG45326.1 GAF domain-containing protein [Calditrichota bacterium]